MDALRWEDLKRWVAETISGPPLPAGRGAMDRGYPEGIPLPLLRSRDRAYSVRVAGRRNHGAAFAPGFLEAPALEAPAFEARGFEAPAPAVAAGGAAATGSPPTGPTKPRRTWLALSPRRLLLVRRMRRYPPGRSWYRGP